MGKTHEEIIKIIKDAHGKLTQDYDLLERARRPLKVSPTLVCNNMTAYCKYTQALSELTSSEIHDATRLALFTNRITLEDVSFCYAQVKAQDEADRAIERKVRWEQWERERQQRNLEYDLSRIVSKGTDEQEAIIQQYIDRVERGEITRDEIHEKAEAIRRAEFEKRIAENNAKYEAQRKEYEAEQKELEEIRADVKLALMYQNPELEYDKEQLNREIEHNIDRLNNRELTRERLQQVANEAREARQKEIEANEERLKNPLFRGKPIKWTAGTMATTKIITDELNGELKNVPTTKQVNMISYEGKEYRREDFLRTHFDEYKKHECKLVFKNDNVFYLSSNRRIKLAYEILAQNFDLVEVAEQDKRDLEQLAASNKGRTYKIWREHMEWENGHEKLMTFGANIDVRRKKPDGKYTSAAKGVYCYSSEITDTQATFSGVSMTWEEWIKPLKDYLDERRERIAAISDKHRRQKAVKYICENDLMCLYYQRIGGEEIRLTLPRDELNKIKLWVDKYLTNGKAAFPYKGEIPNGDLTFTIDFVADVEIVGSYAGVSESNKRRGLSTVKSNVDEIAAKLPGDEWHREDIIHVSSKGKFDRAVKDKELLHVKGRRGYYKRNPNSN